MKTIFTIGFTKKTAEEFFTLLEKNSVSEVVDIRLYNSSQLSGFSKFPDIKYFLKKICNIGYHYDKILAPSKELFNDFKNFEIDWFDYEVRFLTLMEERGANMHMILNYSNADRICLLCSEPTAEQCHRRLVAEKFQMIFEEVKIIHL